MKVLAVLAAAGALVVLFGETALAVILLTVLLLGFLIAAVLFVS